MKLLLHIFPLVTVLLTAAAPAAAQPGGGRHGGPPQAVVEAEERRAFDLLLRAREELRLTEAQVARLEAISSELRARNQPLRERLGAEVARIRAERRAALVRELRPLPPAERRARLRELMDRPPARQLPPEVRPLAEEMRRNIRQATRQAHQVLTPRQRMRARRVFEEHRERRLEQARPHGRIP